MGTTAQFTLQQVTAAAAATELVGNDQGQPPFLRRGIITPFRRDQKADFANDSGVELIRSNVRQVLGTKGPGSNGSGELPWNTEFGSLMHTLRHQNNNPVLEQIALVHVVEALARWEPRVNITDVSIERNRRVLTIAIRFDVIDVSGAGRTILVSGITESVSFPLAA